jgi:hypothetical protein
VKVCGGEVGEVWVAVREGIGVSLRVVVVRRLLWWFESVRWWGAFGGSGVVT